MVRKTRKTTSAFAMLATTQKRTNATFARKTTNACLAYVYRRSAPKVNTLYPCQKTLLPTFAVLLARKLGSMTRLIQQFGSVVYLPEETNALTQNLETHSTSLTYTKMNPISAAPMTLTIPIGQTAAFSVTQTTHQLVRAAALILTAVVNYLKTSRLASNYSDRATSQLIRSCPKT